MDLGISGRTALVCAGTRGLGYASAGELSAAGCRVAICGRDAERVTDAAKRIAGQTGGEVIGLTADLSKPDDVRALVEATKDRLGPVEILVNNTGGPPAGGFAEIDDAAWQASFDGTFMSTVRLYRAVLPGMRQRRWGRIVNIASLAVVQPMDGLIVSNALRLAVQGLSKSLSFELARDSITVNSVCPGFTRTERSEAIIQAMAEREGVDVDEATRRLREANPAGRIGTPEEVAAAVAYLCSELAAFVTGSNLVVAGGAVRGAL